MGPKHVTLIPFWAVRLAARYPGRVYAIYDGIHYHLNRRWA
jgi:hypothetical protein